MRLLLILFLLTGMPFYCNSKKVPKYIRDRFTNCYNGKNTNIKTLIEINGYYELKRLFRVCSGVGVNMICSDTLQHNIVFFEDGTFLYGFSELFPLNQGVYWGIYRIERDTITTQYIFNPSLLSPWDAWEDKYVVLDRETIVMIPSATQPLYRTTKAERKEMAVEMAKRKFLPAKFKQSNNLPPPDSWLKKEAWTKCK